MFDTFGEFDSYEQINDAAFNQLREGDHEAIRTIAKENGIDLEDAEDYIKGEFTELVPNPLIAALGKLDIEKAEMKINDSDLMADWVRYIELECTENEEIAIAVRKKGKSLAGAIGQLLRYAWNHQYEVPNDVKKEANISNRCTFGVPSMGTAKKLIREFYLGE